MAVARVSAGLLCYRRGASGVEVLLVHPGGPFWANKDDGAWSIPKGEIDDGEEPRAAAVREFEEETGFVVGEAPLVELAPVRQRGGKLVRAWMFEGDVDPSAVNSNMFSLEWPPRSGRRQEFPEIDRAAWFSVADARQKILAGQLALLDDLTFRLDDSGA